MLSNELEFYLIQFLASARAKRLCRGYGTDPSEALGDLYIRLLPRATSKAIDVPEAWVHGNATGLLQNYLRREHRVKV